jgi:hypothetical protein
MLEHLTADDNYFQNIFSDEATFHTHVVVNRHNCRIWGSEKPHALMEHVRDSMWCGIMSDRIIGPFFFHESTIMGAVYLDMLENFVFPQTAEVDGLIFQQDGAPPHFGAIVRTALDELFPGRWIGRGGPINWPPRSPDLTPMDLLFWGYIKYIVYSERVESLPINTEGLQRLTLRCLWMCYLGWGVKWNFVSTSVGSSIVLKLICTK